MVASKHRITAFKTKGGRQVILTKTDLVASGLLSAEAATDPAAIQSIVDRLKASNGEERKQLLDAAAARRGLKTKGMREAEVRIERRQKLSPKIEKAAKLIVDRIDATPSSGDMKRFDIKTGKGDDFYSYDIDIYGRERNFAKDGDMGGNTPVKGLMIQAIYLKKDIQGAGLFDAIVNEYQSRHPDRGVYIEQLNNKKLAAKLDRPDNNWQRAPRFAKMNENYWLPPKS